MTIWRYVLALLALATICVQRERRKGKGVEALEVLSENTISHIKQIRQYEEAALLSGCQFNLIGSSFSGSEIPIRQLWFVLKNSRANARTADSARLKNEEDKEEFELLHASSVNKSKEMTFIFARALIEAGLNSLPGCRSQLYAYSMLALYGYQTYAVSNLLQLSGECRFIPLEDNSQ